LPSYEEQIAALARKMDRLEQMLQSQPNSRYDRRIPELATNYDVEDSIFRPTLTGKATANLTLTTGAQAVVGTTITLSPGGIWLITASSLMRDSSGATEAREVYVELNISGAGQTPIMTGILAEGWMGFTTGMAWIVTVTNNEAAQLRSWKSGGTQSTSIIAASTLISAVWIAP